VDFIQVEIVEGAWRDVDESCWLRHDAEGGVRTQGRGEGTRRARHVLGGRDENGRKRYLFGNQFFL
jgi:hypothetical protein